MQQAEYMKRVLETESKPENLAIAATSLDMLFAIGIAAGEVMNKAKRAIFYGKPLEKAELLSALEELVGTGDAFAQVVEHDLFNNEPKVQELFAGQNPDFFGSVDINNVNKRLLHGVIGEISESAEKLEALRNQLMGTQLDIVNFAEELGDSAWYDAIQKDELQLLANGIADFVSGDPIPGIPVSETTIAAFDCSEEAIRARNIAKLEKRNKGKVFNAEATLNRDVEAERTILEGSV